MATNTEKCPVCKLDALVRRMANRVDAAQIECKRCGNFIMGGLLPRIIENGLTDPQDQRLLPYLSIHTRQAFEQGIKTEITTDNWRDFARAHTGTSISQKLMKALKLVADLTVHLGDSVEVDFENDYPLVDATSSDELDYLLSSLVDRNYLKAEAVRCYSVTIEGWDRLEPVRGGIPGRCFIAMSFDPSLNDAYASGIELAVRDCRFDPVRIDREQHNEKICDKILAEIRLCQFMIADFTFHRGNVYFEAGFAMGLERPVIWTCRKDEFTDKKNQFDTRQYNHIVWETPQDLREKLADRIRATIIR